MRRTKTTPEQRARIVELREAGLGAAEIARRLGLTASRVHWACLVEGAERPSGQVRLFSHLAGRIYSRGAHVFRRFTAEEDAAILRQRAAGASVSVIAKGLNPPRRHSSVLARLAILARHQALREEGRALEREAA